MNVFSCNLLAGVGTFAFAPFASYLLSVVSWRTANLVFAGLILSCGVRFLKV